MSLFGRTPLPPPPPDPYTQHLMQYAKLLLQQPPGPFGSFDQPGVAPVALEKSLVAGPIVGYRCWRLFRAAEDYFLAALAFDTVWPAGMPLDAGLPEPHSSVGAWALRGPEDLAPGKYKRDPVAGGRFVCFVIGKVALWGKVIEHEKGYRAQYAYPLTLKAWGNLTPMPGFPASRAITEAIRRTAAIYGIEAQP